MEFSVWGSANYFALRIACFDFLFSLSHLLMCQMNQAIAMVVMNVTTSSTPTIIGILSFTFSPRSSFVVIQFYLPDAATASGNVRETGFGSQEPTGLDFTLSTSGNFPILVDKSPWVSGLAQQLSL